MERTGPTSTSGGRPASPTSWIELHAASARAPRERERIAAHHEPSIRAYLLARWRGQVWLRRMEEATTRTIDVWIGHKGLVTRLDVGQPVGFPSFLLGVTRRVARRIERASIESDPGAPADTQDVARAALLGETPERAFDRAYARVVMQEARGRMAERAERLGAEAMRRVRLLELRFDRGLPLRTLVRRWPEEPAHLHREYARARREFRKAMLDVVRFYEPGTQAEVGVRCQRLLESVG